MRIRKGARELTDEERWFVMKEARTDGVRGREGWTRLRKVKKGDELMSTWLSQGYTKEEKGKEGGKERTYERGMSMPK